MDLDTMWCREFSTMMNQRKAMNAGLRLDDILVPTWHVDTDDRCYIKGIEGVEYFEKLNNTEARLYGRVALKKRKFDYEGKYLRDKEGKYITESITTPNDCVAIVSKVRIGVPNSFKNKEFIYVDMVKLSDESGYLYVIPRRCCYKLNMTALVLSLDKLRNYYEGVGLATTLGYYLFLYIIPYKPRSTVARRYRVLGTKTSIDYRAELAEIQAMWMSLGFIFPPEVCVTESGYKGRDNMALELLPILKEEYIRYDEEKSMSNNYEEPELLGEEDLD